MQCGEWALLKRGRLHFDTSGVLLPLPSLPRKDPYTEVCCPIASKTDLMQLTNRLDYRLSLSSLTPSHDVAVIITDCCPGNHDNTLSACHRFGRVTISALGWYLRDVW